MIFEEYVKENKDWFLWKVKEMASILSINPEWLMFTMKFESGINPKKVNQISNATGLIQFMPSTARELGTSTEGLLKMSNVEQLDFVYKYLKRYKGRMKSWIDVYLAVFYPAAIGKGDNYVIKSDLVAKQNQIFDLNKDLDISVGEIKKVLQEHIPKEYRYLFS